MPDVTAQTIIARSPGLDRGFAVSGPPEGVVYLRPTGLLAGEEAQAACVSGSALPLAGGPLAFTLCEVLHREHRNVTATLAPLSALREWARRQSAALDDHVAALLAALCATRPPFAGLTFDRPRLMGIVNATPDSFSDAGAHFAPEAAIAQGRALVAAGADIIDIGGESTRPGAVAVAPAEELRRVRPVLAGLVDCGAALSIDTRRLAVMRAALDAGARIINDVSALAEPGSLQLAAERAAAVVLMHMQGEPRTMNRAPSYRCAPLDVYDMLAARVAACVAAGIPRAQIAIDPGLGFGKTTGHNFDILRRIGLLHGLGCVVLLGASRKLVFGASHKAVPPAARLGASLGAALTALDQGVQLLRVHDVAETRQAAEIWRGLHHAAAGAPT